jgi:hypothetical protein
MLSHRYALLASVVAGFFAVACSSSQGGSVTACDTSDPCGCVVHPPGDTCVANGATCACTSPSQTDAGPTADAGPTSSDAGPTADAAPPVDLAPFVGKWSPVSGTGQTDCNGTTTSTPPNPYAILTFTQDGPNTMKATSSGAGNCALELVASGQTASLAQSPETCLDNYGNTVEFTAFHLVVIPPPDAADGGMASDAGLGASDAGLGASDAGLGASDAEADATADATADASSSQDAGAALAWHIEDSVRNCVTTLDYTLVRSP